MDKLHYTWDEFFKDAEELARQISQHKPESLIAISRGGLFLAGLLSKYLSIHLVDTICITSYTDDKRGQLDILKSARTDLPHPLIVDDVVDSGETMRYTLEKYNTPSVTLFYKPVSIIKPDYYLHTTDKWISFPWDVTFMKG